ALSKGAGLPLAHGHQDPLLPPAAPDGAGGHRSRGLRVLHAVGTLSLTRRPGICPWPALLFGWARLLAPRTVGQSRPHGSGAAGVRPREGGRTAGAVWARTPLGKPCLIN